MPERHMADRSISVFVTIIAMIAVFTVLYFTKTVFAPVACALFMIAIVWPLQSGLQVYLPKLLALAIVILITAAACMIFASLVTWGFGRVGRSLVADAARFQTLYEQVTVWLDGHGIMV